MKLKKASKKLTRKCKELGAEIAFDDGGADIYWNNVRIQPSHSNLKKCLKAIEVLVELGAEDQ